MFRQFLQSFLAKKRFLWTNNR